MIELKQLSKTYQSFQALDNIDLTIQPKEIFGILGKSGAGKSTLLRCVNLLEHPSSGQIYVNNTDLLSLSLDKLREVRHKISMIFQHFNLLSSRNVFDNIALPLEILKWRKDHIQEKVLSLLELVNLSDRQNHFPHQLSGGQKQRVAIARALATDPLVLLSDEATSALDTHSTKSILDLLKKINENLDVTILLITHELDVIKQICHRVAVLDQGKLIEHGNTIDVLLNPQSAITKQLVQKTYEFSPHANSLLLKLIFIGDSTEGPLISLVSKKFDIALNIKEAQIEKIQDITVGFTVCELTGDAAELKNALAYIHSTNVKVEVLKHG